MFNSFRLGLWRKSVEYANDSEEHLPQLTVLINAVDNSEGLERHLPAILTQDYEQGFEVVVVTERDNPSVEALLKHYEKDERFHSSFIPSETMFLSRRKLAVTLGVKAARNEWIVLVDADCTPISDEWLTTLARKIEPRTDIVLAYCNYEASTNRYRRFLQFRNAFRFLKPALSSSAYCSCGSNIVFKKNDFLTKQPYKTNLKSEYGEYDFLVKNLSEKLNTQVCMAKDAQVRRDEPSTEQWRSENMIRIYTRKNLHHFFLTTTKDFCCQLILWLNGMLIATLSVCAVMFQNWYALGGAILAFLLTIGIRLRVFQFVTRLFSEQFPFWLAVFFYEPSILFHDVIEFFHYQYYNKSKFYTHKP